MADRDSHPRFDERRMRMLNLAQEGMSLSKIGEIFGISRERVRQILAKDFNRSAFIAARSYCALVERGKRSDSIEKIKERLESHVKSLGKPNVSGAAGTGQRYIHLQYLKNRRRYRIAQKVCLDCKNPVALRLTLKNRIHFATLCEEHLGKVSIIRKVADRGG
jgi:DNA-binding CsgD family transcriptional regulator